MMSCYSKENLNKNEYNNMCKSHSARSDREIYRICPSKLSKRELEDLYFSLLEDNLELKRTVNGQHDKIKGLSTKVQRMTAAQKQLQSKELKDCCVGSKLVISDQRESITELRRANQRLSDKVQQLNMRLCSAKQFYKKTPSQPPTSRCLRCATVTTGAPMIKRHSNIDKSSETVPMLSTSIQCDDSPKSAKSAQTEDENVDKATSKRTCDENRCKTLMQELKMKIVNLQEELCMVHEDYSSRLGRLESEVSAVRRENVRVVGERSASLQQLHASLQQHGDLVAHCRLLEARCAELEAQLTIEKRRVAELETHLKAANMSDKVNRTIEDHLININETKTTEAVVATTKDAMSVITNVTPSNAATKGSTKGITKNSNGGISKMTSNGSTKTTTNDTAKSTTNGTTRSTTNGTTKFTTNGTTRSTTNGTTKSATNGANKAIPKGIPEAVFTNATPQAFTNVTPQTTDTTHKTNASDSITDITNATSNETKTDAVTDATNNANDTINAATDREGKGYRIPSNVTIDNNTPTIATNEDNVPTHANQAATIEDNVSKNVTTNVKDLENTTIDKKIPNNAINNDNIPTNATIDDNIPTNATNDDNIPTSATKDDNIPTNATNDDNIPTNVTDGQNIPTIATKTVTMNGSVSPQRDMKGTADSSPKTTCPCFERPPPRYQTPIMCLCPSQWVDSGDSQDNNNTSGLTKAKFGKLIKFTNKTTSTAGSKVDDCGCTSHQLMETDLSNASSTKEDARCRKCCYKELDSSVMESIAKNVVPTTATANADDTQASPTKPEEVKAKASDDSGYLDSNRSQDTDELGIHKLNKELLAKVRELQIQVESLRRAQVSNMSETKKKLDETLSSPSNSIDMSTQPIRPERPTRVKNVEKRQLPVPTTAQTSVKGDDEPTRPATNKHYPDSPEKGETRKYNMYHNAAVTQENEEHKTSALAENTSLVTQYKRNTSELTVSMDLTHTQTDGKLEVMNEMTTIRESSDQDLAQATETNEGRTSTEERVQDGYKYTTQQSRQTEQSRTEPKQAENSSVDSPYKFGASSLTGSLTSNPEIGVIVHSNLARNNVRETGEASKLFGGSDSDCTFDRECATRRRNTTESGNTSLGKETKKEQATKTDRHNSLQIPGPLSADNYKKRSVFKRFSLDKKRDKQKQAAAVAKYSSATADGPIKLPDVSLIDQPRADSLVDVKGHNAFLHGRDSLDAQRNRNSRDRQSSAGFKDHDANVLYAPDPLSDRTMPTMLEQDYRSDSEDERMKAQTKEQASQAAHGVQVERGLTTHQVSISSEQGTYTVHNKEARSVSYENTDYELSNISDLPLEKDGKSPGKARALSPGEDKTTTTTYSESYCSPTTNYSLSEGEVPTTSKRKVSYETSREKRDDDAVRQSGDSTAKMEAALRAITEELAHCKALLQARPQPQSNGQQVSSGSQTAVSGVARPIALRPGVATQSIGDAYAPKCIFTLHIGTVVLSDEAVLSSRDRTMVLTWKFYDQNVAMTRMRPGRVVLFDFSTEYDIKITDHFLNYMKYEEMKITICELDKEDQPFATCSLPLRDALLHTNRRADMSLALLAGPRLMRVHDALDGGDEVGVIDLWCMLRAEPHMLPGINHAIAQQSPTLNQPTDPCNSRVMKQILDDEHYNDFDLALDNASVSISPDTNELPHFDKNIAGDAERDRTSYYFNLAKTAPASVSDGPTHTAKQELAFDLSKYPPMRKRRGSGTPPSNDFSTATPTAGNEDHDNPERDSGIIINDVLPKIKSPDDMKQVLEKSYDFGRFVKPEDDAMSKANSSLSSLKSTAKLQRRSSRGPHKLESQRAVLQNIRKMSHNRNEASKKCVKIQPSLTDSEAEEPQRDEEYFSEGEEEIDGAQRLDITVLWLALNEECEAMVDPHVQRLYVAYTFLGRAGAELETPVSLPKPKHYVDKCYFNFKKTFELEEADLIKLGHMARCRAASKMSQDERDCIIFSVVSEPDEDPLGIESCEDIGYAYLYLGDLLAYSAGSSGYTEVVPVRAARAPAGVCGVLAVRLDGLHVLRRFSLFYLVYSVTDMRFRRHSFVKNSETRRSDSRNQCQCYCAVLTNKHTHIHYKYCTASLLLEYNNDNEITNKEHMFLMFNLH
ncbi:hypothetical protein HW555_003448 [Spodoptera exigua]|uniref:Uncharacterized protein n=1 Tax=Spodoptera exigua TaxID=7107 RepID=A0A835L8F6_SPOEX|nr:hypothetical protein HW555_003448 [Spodoptera exigua]